MRAVLLSRLSLSFERKEIGVFARRRFIFLTDFFSLAGQTKLGKSVRSVAKMGYTCRWAKVENIKAD